MVAGTQKEIVALICCRGGSKGIPGKNIKSFCGVPLLVWLINSAKTTNLFDRIILSTDSEEIASVAECAGVEVPVLRPDYLATDTADQFDAHKHIFEHLGFTDATHSVCVLNNNPFIHPDLILSSADLYEELNGEHVCVDSVEVPGDFVFFRQSKEVGHLLFPIFPLEHKQSKINRQSASKCISPINNIRWGRPSQLDSYEHFKDSFVNHGHGSIRIPKLCNFDLDEPEDWIIAEAMMEKMIEMGKFVRGNR